MEYGSEYRPGAITATGDIDSSVNRIYKINFDGSGDWDSWPWRYGAPLVKTATGDDSLDADGNPIPLLIGDQTLWMINHDFDERSHDYIFTTKPLGLEVQITIWGYDDVPPYSDMMFVAWKLLNKGEHSINDAYVTLFLDYDIGDASNDLVGCDTTLSLGYGYQREYDAVYESNSPGFGFVLLQGPLVPAPGHIGYCFGKEFNDAKNLPMTAFIGSG